MPHASDPPEDELNSPAFPTVKDPVQSEESHDAIHCTCVDEGAEYVVGRRTIDSPVREVALLAGVPPVPTAAEETNSEPALAPRT